MATVNNYVNSNVAAGKKANPANQGGAHLLTSIVTFEVAAADDNGSVYRLIKGLPGNMVPVKIDIICDAITAGTDYDLGFYQTDLGAAVDQDCLADGLDLSSAATKNGLVTVDAASLGKKVYELAGHTADSQLASYDLALTANTVGTAAGTITAIVYFSQG